MNRRNFLSTTLTTALASAPIFASAPILAAAPAAARPASGINVRDYFESDSEEVLRLTQSVFDHCILGKIHPPRGELKHRWLAPGGGYKGQWVWDTMFVTDLLAILTNQKEVLREVFANYCSVS
jgi:hypothetical protein